MTTQDAGRQAADGAPLAQEADRLASMIRPAWEVDLDEGEIEHPPPLAAEGAAAAPATGEPNEAEKANFDRIAERISQGGADPSATTGSSAPLAPPRDTVIEG